MNNLKFASFIGSIKNNIVILCLSCIGFVINFITYYPGYLSPDSLDQFSQALHNHYGDWHPPLMSAFWHALLSLYIGPQPMLFFQLFLLWGSCYILLLLFKKHYPRTIWLVFVFLCAPFVQNFAGNIWKDVHMALSWLLAAAILLNAFYNHRKLNTYESIISMLLLAYGCWVRLNALPGLLPLVALWLMLLKKPEASYSLFGFRSIIKTVGVCVIILLTQAVITKFAIKPNKEYSIYKLFAHDISGIYVKTGENYFPDFITQHEGFDTLYLKKNYRYATFDNIWWNPDNKKILPGVDDAKIKELRNSWIKAISEHPIVYFKNRTNGFLAFLRISNEGDYYCSFYPFIHSNNFGFRVEPNVLSRILLPLIEGQKDFFYMQPWFWSLFNVIIFLCAFIKQLRAIKPIILVLSLSGLFYLALEFFIYQVDSDFRYFYWNCIVSFLAFILIISQLVKYRSENRRAAV